MDADAVPVIGTQGLKPVGNVPDVQDLAGEVCGE
jgi:hypothetical protein